jgi:hypothetical protein
LGIGRGLTPGVGRATCSNHTAMYRVLGRFCHRCAIRPVQDLRSVVPEPAPARAPPGPYGSDDIDDCHEELTFDPAY